MENHYDIGSVVFNNWTIKKKLGEGSFGKVFEAEREDFGEVYKSALKVITVPQNDSEYESLMEEGMSEGQARDYFKSVVEDISREIAIMSRLKGTGNIVSLEDHAAFEHSDKRGWDILIRMELLNPLLPFTYEHPMARRDIIKLGIDICRALELCQKYNIIHRDIKPENIFVSDNGDYKLGDFGIARTIEKTMSGLSKKGTYNYMAPEIYRGGEYGFSVDTYSLGIVLYRMLNRNRVPFLPPPPEPITYHNREASLARRMSGEKIPDPFYGEGRLGEIVLKACAFDPKDRYSSPSDMREELEAILYDENDAKLIYPDGDEIELMRNQYASKTPSAENKDYTADSTEGTSMEFENRGKAERSEDKTSSIFGSHDKADKTESVFSKKNTEDRTESVFSERKTNPRVSVKKQEVKKKKSKALPVCIAAAVVIAVGAGVFLSGNSKKNEEKYKTTMDTAFSFCETDPNEAKELFLKAGNMKKEETEPKIGYAYALYLNREYDECITYIEDELALGKAYDVEVQSRLAEILSASYFEKRDYANAAAFFRLSTVGGDITVNAMRDYAVSLGRLGDVDAAEKVLEIMYASGAEGDVTDYVKAEIDFSQGEYVNAEQGFLNVRNNAEERDLQIRAFRSLSEVYTKCAELEKLGEHHLASPAVSAAEVLSKGIAEFGLEYDSSFIEMLAKAYYDSYKESGNTAYLQKSASSFSQLLDMGITKDYIYGNIYNIYYQLGDYTKASEILKAYEEKYPNRYEPNAFRAVMLINMGNNSKDEGLFQKAWDEYVTAYGKYSPSDNKVYLEQVYSLFNELSENGWYTNEDLLKYSTNNL